MVSKRLIGFHKFSNDLLCIHRCNPGPRQRFRYYTDLSHNYPFKLRSIYTKYSLHKIPFFLSFNTGRVIKKISSPVVVDLFLDRIAHIEAEYGPIKPYILKISLPELSFTLLMASDLQNNARTQMFSLVISMNYVIFPLLR